MEGAPQRRRKQLRLEEEPWRWRNKEEAMREASTRGELGDASLEGG